MATKIETLERALLYKALADKGDLEALRQIFDIIVEEAQTDIEIYGLCI